MCAASPAKTGHNLAALKLPGTVKRVHCRCPLKDDDHLFVCVVDVEVCPSRSRLKHISRRAEHVGPGVFRHLQNRYTVGELEVGLGAEYVRVAHCPILMYVANLDKPGRGPPVGGHSRTLAQPTFLAGLVADGLDVVAVWIEDVAAVVVGVVDR